MNARNWKTAVCASGSILLGGVAIKLLKISNVFSSRRNHDVPVNEVLLYGANDEVQTKQIGLNNLFCIYYVIVHANCSIDVCLPDLESETIAKCLIGAQKNKVKVRLIVHSNRDFDMPKLIKHGIEVKIITSRSREPLEHEYILVDADAETRGAVAVMGSLDYETARVNCNRDATLLTSEPSVVKSLKREFDRVWNSTDSENIPKSTTTETY
ncbi:uncharacterized protein LOC134680544 [Cydia fagiglandana]|uniref:uncharacterized protein LOC134680544 n=1 Tax=Cydia fagiglandana TaxID=1458189 RepID=UPI002FEE1360